VAGRAAGEREIAERRSAGKGLTSPELALLLAHTKISAAEDVLASGLPDDPYLRRVLDAYFPAPLRATFADRMEIPSAAHGRSSPPQRSTRWSTRRASRSCSG
jgi:NAD-specific glutamate dehydrogenase